MHHPAPPAPPSDPTAVVALDHVARRFGRVPALTDLSLTVLRGAVTVLLGPNGAGKTTAIRVVTGALLPDRGTVRVFGLDPATDGEEVRRRCGVVSAKPALYDRLSGRDNLAYAAALYGLPRGTPVEPAAARFGIEAALDQQVGGYSTGMKTRLALARAVLHQPDLLLLDEPTSGLDPESSVAVLELIRGMAAEGATVVLCTHLLLEAEGLADQVVVLEDGSDLVAGAPDELARRYWGAAVVRLGAEDPDTLAGLGALPGVMLVNPDGDGTVYAEVDDLRRVPDLVGALTAAGARLTRVEPYQPTLEDLYFAVRQLRRGEMDSVPAARVPDTPIPARAGRDAGRSA